MAKTILAAHYWQRKNDPVRRIATRGQVQLKADIKACLAKLPDLLPKDASLYGHRGNWWGLLHAIDWTHFGATLRTPFGQIGKIREAAAQLGAQQINALHARAGRPVRFKKYRPDQPRDERGRWVAAGTASTATINVSGKDVKVSLSRQSQAGGDRLVNVIVHWVNAAWKRDQGFYVGPGGEGAGITGRYQRFGDWMAGHDHMEASEMGVMPDGSVGFTNGRHRFAWLRDQGMGVIPVAMDKESIANARKHGYLSSKVLKFAKGVPGLLDELFDVSTELVHKDAGDEFAFDMYDEDLQAELRQAQNDLIAQLSQGVRDTVEVAVMNGARLGLSPDEIVDDIRSVITLTDRQAQAVLNYRDMLESLDATALERRLRNMGEDATVQEAIDAGTPLDQAMVDRLVDDYRENYLDYRADMIAQTESTRAANLGIQDVYQQAIDRGVFSEDVVRQHWKIDTGERVCPVCRSIPGRNPDGVPIGEPFDSIAGPFDAPPDPHPNCQCSIEVVTDLGSLTAESPEEAA